MNIKKRIKEHFNSIQLPSADKVLPESASVDKQLKTYKKITLRLAVAVLCIGVITSVVLVLNKSSEPSPNISISDNLSQDESFDSNEENSINTETESAQIDQSDIQQEPDCQEPNNPEPNNPEPNNPVITIYTEEVVGEFAGDMYRPDGYNEKIGSVLAIMMSMNKDEERKFNVLVHTYDGIDLKDLLLQTVGSAEVITVEINGKFAGNAYYVCLTDAQIKELTGYGLNCYYIGNGLGDYRDMNWETEEGIRTYCEIWGDMYTFNNRGVSLEPDIYIED